MTDLDWALGDLQAEIDQLRMQLADHGETITRLETEIERLRAAHQEIRELGNNKIVSGEGLFMRALLIARRALEPKP
jgi:prefoldin subunit 5